MHSLPCVPKVVGVTEELTYDILSKMRHDEISIVAKTDPLILKMGSEFHKSRSHYSERHYVSREMRDLARLLIELRKFNPQIKTLENSFSAVHFGMTYIQAMETLSGYEQKTGEVKIVSMAYRVLQPLHKSLLIVRRE